MSYVVCRQVLKLLCCVREAGVAVFCVVFRELASVLLGTAMICCGACFREQVLKLCIVLRCVRASAGVKVV